ncbi:oxidoreductase [Bacillus sp. AK128]
MNQKSALIAGASGLVGSELLTYLLNEPGYEKVNAIVRKPLGIEHPKLMEIICDFDKLEEVQEYFAVDDVFCCLGTTIKKAKTKEAMYKVDVEYPLTIAKLAREKGIAQHFILISSMNANSASRIWYSKMKGILEEKLQAMSFPTISIIRPSLLLGDRNEFRFGENTAIKVFKGLSLFIKGSWKSRLAIEANTVARAMHKISQMDQVGITFYDAKALADIGEDKH